MPVMLVYMLVFSCSKMHKPVEVSTLLLQQTKRNRKTNTQLTLFVMAPQYRQRKNRKENTMCLRKELKKQKGKKLIDHTGMGLCCTHRESFLESWPLCRTAVFSLTERSLRDLLWERTCV